MRRFWWVFRRNPLSLLGLALVTVVVVAAAGADIVAPFPDHRGAVVDFANFNKPPDWTYLFGTDLVGRDLFSRILYAYRLSLLLGLVVLAIAPPIGVIVGLAAGYFGGWVDFALMRMTDVFLSIPPLVLAMSIMGFLEPTLFNGMIAVTEEPWATAREELVVVAFVTNPDGVDHVTNWYRETVGKPYESTGLLKLYQYYSGHDNNRDWFMLTQAETRIVTQMLYSEWFPTIYWDVHQQGSGSERFFVPPFRDPLNPNLDPAIISGINAVGNRALLDLTRDGLSGVATGVSYDMWWNGGNRNVPVRHNIIGLLTEAASVRIASPLFQRKDELSSPVGGAYRPSNQFPNPWPGGWWRLADIINYQVAFARSLLGSLSREPQFWLSNSMEAAERTIAGGAVTAPRGWIIPSDNRDPDAVRRLMDSMMLSGIEVHVAEAPIEADGRTYPAGSIVVLSHQPYGRHARDLMEVQRYPDGSPPYDVAGWTLPFLLGVRRIEVIEQLDTDALEMVGTPDEATAAFAGDPRLSDMDKAMSLNHSSTWTALAKGLAEGADYRIDIAGDNAGVVTPFDDSQTPNDTSIMIESMPRIGLYSPWTGSMDEGWMRYVLDTYEIPYTTARNEQLRAGQINDFLDVLIIPDIGGRQLDAGRSPGSIPDDYARGLDPEGAVAIEEFVRNGGTLITFDSSSQWAIDLFKLPVVNVASGPDANGFSCPGSVLRSIPEHSSRFTTALPESVGLFFSRSSAYREMTEDERKKAGIEESQVQTLLRYAPTRVLLSGWIKEPQVIENKSAWMRAEHGQGAVHLFGFRPQYRGWTQATFPLVFRAALFE